jgi:hypothetical protein
MYPRNSGIGTKLRTLNATTNKPIVIASFTFEPWLKLRATACDWRAPEYRNAKKENTAFGNKLIILPKAKAQPVCLFTNKISIALKIAELTSWKTNPVIAIFLPAAMDVSFPVNSGFSLSKSAEIILFY